MDTARDRRQSIVDKYKCLACSKILQKPVQLPCCGIRVCRSCVNLICYGCKTELNGGEFSDVKIEKEIENMDIQCEHCCLNMKLCNYQYHLSNCQYEIGASNGEQGQMEEKVGEVPGNISAFIGQYENISPISYSSSVNAGDDDQVVPEAPPNNSLSANDGQGSVPDVDGQGSVPDVMQADLNDNLVTRSPLANSPCGECGDLIPNDSYERHKETCYRGLLHYNGPSYPKPEKVVSQESLCTSGNNELVINNCEPLVSHEPYMVSHKIEITKNGKAVRECAAPLDMSGYYTDQIRQEIHDKLPIEIPQIGKICWKISYVSTLLVCHERILSSPFYTKEGYKLRLQLDFNHPTLHLLAMCGENDASLPWPLLCSIDFGIIRFGIKNDIYERIFTHKIHQVYVDDFNIVTSLPLPPDMFHSDSLKDDNAFINCHVRKAQ